MKNKNHLGQGIDNIFEEEKEFTLDSKKIFTDNHYSQKILNIDLTKIFSNPLQPRKIFDEKKIVELAESIKMYGLISPIILKKIKKKKNITLLLEKEDLEPAKLLNNKKIKAIVFEKKIKSENETAIIENIQRENLNSLEEALAYKKIIQENNFTHAEIAKKFAKTRTYITNILRILNLPEVVQNLVLENKISQGHAKTLLSLENNELIIKVAKRIVKENLSVRNVENIVNGYKLQNHRSLLKFKKEDYTKYSKKLKKFLNTKVLIKKNKKIVISFENENDLIKILEKIGVIKQ